MPPLSHDIRKHWLRYRPKMCAELEANGELDAVIESTADRTSGVISAALREGLSPDQARELGREIWCLREEGDDGKPYED